MERVKLVFLHLLLHSVTGQHSDKKENIRFFCEEHGEGEGHRHDDDDDDDHGADDRIRLFLGMEDLEIDCTLHAVDEDDTKHSALSLIVLYSSLGLFPSLEIYTSSFTAVFSFTLSKTVEDCGWHIEIPRSSLTERTDVAPVEELFVSVQLHHGLHMYKTEGTLLDTVRGVYLGVTKSGFSHGDTVWYNVTDNLCAVFSRDCFELCYRLYPVDIIVTNHHLLILTTLGLYISQDLRDASNSSLKFRKEDFVKMTTEDYSKGSLWYSSHCLAKKEDYEVDFVSLTTTNFRTDEKISACVYSVEPFSKWHDCIHKMDQANNTSTTVKSFQIHNQVLSGITLAHDQDGAFVVVNNLADRNVSVRHASEGGLKRLAEKNLKTRTKFPWFRFPDKKFVPRGMFFQPGNHLLYVYGTQVWVSDNGGNSFTRVIKLYDETCVAAVSCEHVHQLFFITDKGNIYHSTLGAKRYSKLGALGFNLSSIFCDHIGSLYVVSFNVSEPDKMTTRAIDYKSLIKVDDFGFDRPLSFQFLTEKMVVLFEHLPLKGSPRIDYHFSSEFVTKVITFQPNGLGEIKKAYSIQNDIGFVAIAEVMILDPFTVESLRDSPCQQYSIILTARPDKSVAIELQQVGNGDGFQATDIEKTVVIPGYSSLMIIKVQSKSVALAHATMPDTVPYNEVFKSVKWFMYNFGAGKGRRWKIVEDSCKRELQQVEKVRVNSVIFLDVRDEITLTFKAAVTDEVIPVFQQKLIVVTMGNPEVLEVESVHSWDDFGNHIVVFKARNKFYERHYTTVVVVVRDSSLQCELASFSAMLKSSCPTGKMIYYVSPVAITDSEWLSGNAKDSKGADLLISLPVNYRPPSQRGISIPLTDNIYNADPSKPRLRDYYQTSKKSGKFKQCAGKLSREECGCTESMKLSSLAAFSDCRERVLRMTYPVSNMPIKLFLKIGNKPGEPLNSPYFVTVTEVNNRSNWEVTGTNSTPTMLKLRTYLKATLNSTLYNPDGLKITLIGSELFHFRVSVILGVSMCNLEDEFQIYVDDPPLAFPTSFLIGTGTAVVLGGILFLLFVLYQYDVQVPQWNNIKKRIMRRNQVVPFDTDSSGIQLD
nr:PREDICTED: cation channel sperm-associated protein subunit beta isoform X2 [Latimeria chalumnae]|eukprot:XP_014341836.1 PREDICTED: cation channel sperm-associated protein subunit beta isoform X2 [Latimeria chalumnae]